MPGFKVLACGCSGACCFRVHSCVACTLCMTLACQANPHWQLRCCNPVVGPAELRILHDSKGQKASRAQRAAQRHKLASQGAVTKSTATGVAGTGSLNTANAACRLARGVTHSAAASGAGSRKMQLLRVYVCSCVLHLACHVVSNQHFSACSAGFRAWLPLLHGQRLPSHVLLPQLASGAICFRHLALSTACRTLACPT